MIELVIAAALQAADPCQAVERPAAQAGCPAWRALASTAQGELFVDPASLRRDGAAFEILVRFVYAEAAADVIRSLATQFRFDCAGRTVAMGRGHAYDAAGVQLDEEEPNEGFSPPAPVLPDAPEAAVLTAYCPG